MRIAYVISTLDRCGPVNVLYDIISNLPSQYETTIFTLANEPKSSRINDFRQIGCHVYCICNSRIKSMLVGSKLLSKALDSFRPDIVHAHGFRAYLICRGLNYSTVATVHNCIYEDFLTSYGERQARWMTRKEIAALREFDALVACSASNAEFLKREYGLACECVHNGVDQNRFISLDANDRRNLRRELGIEPGRTLLVTTGGCSEWKGTLPLVSGFNSALADSNASAELHVFGQGPLFEECRGMRLDNVYFHGFDPNVVPWLQAADLFVSASRSEGMPLAVLEALSCGCPALLSDIAPHREIADAVTGQGCVQLFDATDEASCAKGITGVLAAIPERPQSVACFGAKEMADGYATIYKNLSKKVSL
ncbi:MAG: glycosyltransferase family 4 protein [Phoenicibacter congonensis]|uniref:Glycosyltransferase family 4 protein n=1 Tax=Phoenicibacter congonensis TaxID=1944646 RepID=A0AA43U8H2_9ACTN|nr:glycosyltransferase family 4 protein [Phoenicibacter congonensis]